MLRKSCPTWWLAWTRTRLLFEFVDFLQLDTATRIAVFAKLEPFPWETIRPLLSDGKALLKDTSSLDLLMRTILAEASPENAKEMIKLLGINSLEEIGENFVFQHLFIGRLSKRNHNLLYDLLLAERPIVKGFKVTTGLMARLQADVRGWRPLTWLIERGYVPSFDTLLAVLDNPGARNGSEGLGLSAIALLERMLPELSSEQAGMLAGLPLRGDRAVEIHARLLRPLGLCWLDQERMMQLLFGLNFDELFNVLLSPSLAALPYDRHGLLVHFACHRLFPPSSVPAGAVFTAEERVTFIDAFIGSYLNDFHRDQRLSGEKQQRFLADQWLKALWKILFDLVNILRVQALRRVRHFRQGALPHPPERAECGKGFGDCPLHLRRLHLALPHQGRRPRLPLSL